MKAFFDTSVYINAFFKQVLSKQEFEKYFNLYDIVVCPLVRHELLLGTIHPKTRQQLVRFFDQCPILEAPTRKMWDELTALMQKLKWKENRQQNDVLMALTAQKEEATLITFDKHFEQIRKHANFDMVLLCEE